MKKDKTIICIDPGRGGSDTGRAAFGAKEKDLTLSFSKALQTALKKSGFELLMTREKDQDVTEAARAKIANQSNFVISLHCDASADPAENGFSAGFYWPVNEEKAAALVNGFPAKVKYEQLQIMRDSTPPAVLLRVGFITNKDEVEKMKSAEYFNDIAGKISDNLKKLWQ